MKAQALVDTAQLLVAGHRGLCLKRSVPAALFKVPSTVG